MPYSEILRVVLPTFIAILIGYILGKTIKIDMSGVVDIVFYVGLPALAFVSILSQQIVLMDAAKVWASNLLVTLGCGLAGWLVFRVKKEKHTGLYLPISLPNTVNIPFPIISLAYGSAGLLVATLYYIPNILMLYSLGIFISAGKSWRENLKTMLKVPTIYVAILALVLNFLKIEVPEIIVKPLDFIGGMVVPLVVLTLGYSLSQVRITSIYTTLLASAIRLGGGLGLGLLVAALFDLTGVFRSVVVLVSAMPAAVNTYMITAKYKSEEGLVASVVFVTTIISLILIPFLLHMLG
ncbi:MAG: AEC family transporter [Dehalococcoidales bacterium]|nr:AEC family transporter [Dehalococcoidales bacterium]